jgi:hypothetical protein
LFSPAALADWLFYGHGIGISAAIFAVAVACGSLLANLATLKRKQVLLAGPLLLVALVPAIEEFNVASLTFIVLALGIGLLLTTNRDRHGLGERAAALCDLYLVGPVQIFPRCHRWVQPAGIENRVCRVVIRSFSAASSYFCWYPPIHCSEKWISLLNPGNTAYVSLGRVLLGRGAVDRVAFIHVRWSGKRRCRQAWPKGGTGAGNAIGPKRLLRCCDDPAFADPVQFAVRRSNRSDVAYLWGNATCLADISYASYAHRGAYPLIVTALLAAGFRSDAMRPWAGRAIEGDPAAGLSMGGAKCPAGAVIDPAPRSLCSNLSADLVARRGFIWMVLVALGSCLSSPASF